MLQMLKEKALVDDISRGNSFVLCTPPKICENLGSKIRRKVVVKF